MMLKKTMLEIMMLKKTMLENDKTMILNGKNDARNNDTENKDSRNIDAEK